MTPQLVSEWSSLTDKKLEWLALRMDIDGLVPGTANFCPDLFVRLWRTRNPKLLTEFDAIKKRIAELAPGDYLTGLKALLQGSNLLR